MSSSYKSRSCLLRTYYLPFLTRFVPSYAYIFYNPFISERLNLLIENPRLLNTQSQTGAVDGVGFVLFEWDKGGSENN